MPWNDEPLEEQKIFENNPYICPVCGSDDCVPPYYGTNSDVLLIGEFPGEDEVVRGKPLVGPTGRLLESELRYLGLSLRSYRLCNLWQHPPNKNDKCLEHGAKVVLEEAKEKKLVVLIGSDTVKFFTGESVSEWNGLLVESAMLDNPYIMAMIQPASAFRSSLGEVRFGLKQFKYYVERIKQDEFQKG